eukprot:20579-Heterococcus_DN1.PRE.2
MRCVCYPLLLLLAAHTNRAVIGTYDDHDSGWNNGDSRTPRKAAFKEMFLDAIGEPRDSPRHAPEDVVATAKYHSCRSINLCDQLLEHRLTLTAHRVVLTLCFTAFCLAT